MYRLLMTTLFLTAATTAAAQTPAMPMLELRPMAGALIPTGDQRDLFKDAVLYGAQVAFEYRPNVHIVGSFGWSPGHDRFAVADQKVNLFQYDVGAEYNLLYPLGSGWELKPFLGAGVGARTYDYAAATLQTRTCAAGYGTLGTELQYGAVGLRLEARDYVHCFKNPVSDQSNTRNEVGLTAGFVYHLGHRRP
jgi:hypothetical protein